jgi:hypothetical protein
MNATGINSLDRNTALDHRPDDLVLANLVERFRSGGTVTDYDGLANRRAHEMVFKGEALEACGSTGDWLPVVHFIALIQFLSQATQSPAGIAERLLAGEVVRVNHVYIRKTPEARRGLSKSHL